MKTKLLTQTSLFPATREEVFEKIRALETLQYVAAPFASFSPADGKGGPAWRQGETFAFHVRLFGVFPLGVHTMYVLDLNNAAFRIYTHESNRHVPVWNHRILLAPAPSGTLYTDEVEIGAGWKTPAVLLWAKCFYAHRQRRWKGLLAGHGPKVS